MKRGREYPDNIFDKDQLSSGIKVEKEHTDDKKEAKRIAKDHLIEDAEYYTNLKNMENKHNDTKAKDKHKRLNKNLKPYLPRRK
jgi:hypothetical protein